MDRELVETFLAITELKTISGAAGMLYVSQSTVSHRLNCLEDYIGTPLFERQRGFKTVTLTQAGEMFVPLAHHWLELDNRVRQLNQAQRIHKIYIAGMDSVNQYLLTSMLPAIRMSEPSLNMELRSLHSWEIYRKLSAREIDIGFAYNPIHYSDIIAIPVFREPVMMISSPDSIYEDKLIHPSTLCKSDEVYYSWESRLVQWHNEWWPIYDAPFVKVDSCGLLQNFIVTEKNWAMCPASVASSLHASGMVKKHHFAENPPDRICYMLTRKAPKGSTDPGVELFTAAFMSQLEKHPWRYSNAD